MSETHNRVTRLIVGTLGCEEGEVTPNAHFVDDLNCDSLDEMELMIAFEDDFDIEISDEDAKQIRTVQDAIKYLESRNR